MASQELDNLFALVKELASPRVWSAGVELARNGEFQETPSNDSTENAYVITNGPRDTSTRVTLSAESEIWQCNCGSDNDPCVHVVATILAVRQQKILLPHTLQRAGTSFAARIQYDLRTEGSFLAFYRSILRGDDVFPVCGTLIKAIEEVTKRGSGIRTVAASNDELMLDHVLGNEREGVLSPRTLKLLLHALQRIPNVRLDGSPVTILDRPVVPWISVEDHPSGGFSLTRQVDVTVLSYFTNGVALVESPASSMGDGAVKELATVEDSGLTATELERFANGGIVYPEHEWIHLASVVLPSFASRIKVVFRTKRISRARSVEPRLIFEAIGDQNGESLTVVPHIVYGNPPLARVDGSALIIESSKEIPIRNVVTENVLQRQLLQQFGMKLGEGKQLLGEQGPIFLQRAKKHLASSSATVEYATASTLHPRLVESGQLLSCVFLANKEKEEISFSHVDRAFHSGSNFVQGPSGKWYALPTEWLREHGDIVRSLLDGGIDPVHVPAARVGKFLHFCDRAQLPPPQYLTELRNSLRGDNGFQEFYLPEGFLAELRDYQRHGVNWIATLKNAGVGALLADDMGLGKTVQAIPHLTRRALVVVPTSVLYSWENQLQTFYPSLSVCRYHGPDRCFSVEADVVLTTYTICRLELELFSSETWNILVLDEAQTIRNPDSLVSQAVRAIPSAFRLCLSGTPVENSLKDLWSQSEFLNPGLLGQYQDFARQFEKVLDRNGNDPAMLLQLQRTVQPFILRRLKTEVAKELPPKTEVVLECELSAQERQHYESVLLATRSEVISQVAEGASPLRALELLLRLRQCCCHIGLLPGIEEFSSSKVELLKECLLASKLQGHRSLVFSQWTSFLDLIEPHLRQSGLTFLRIDGSTQNRDEVVRTFQSEAGPDLLLLSLKAGGVGLTLTAADHVYILDPWWNPAVEDQAADRAHRIGQENPVFVYRLVARETVEERVLELQSRKRAMLSAVVGDSGGISLSRDELLYLLDPTKK